MPRTNLLYTRGTKYYFRRRIPTDLVNAKAYGETTEIWESLGTSDKREADRLAHFRALELLDEWERKRSELRAKGGPGYVRRSNGVTTKRPLSSLTALERRAFIHGLFIRLEKSALEGGVRDPGSLPDRAVTDLIENTKTDLTVMTGHSSYAPLDWDEKLAKALEEQEIEVDAVSLANILNNPTIVTASGSGKTFKPQDFLDLVAEVKDLDTLLEPKIHALNAGRLLSQEQGRAGLLKLIDNKSASGSTGNFLELLVTRGFQRGAFNTSGVVRELKGFRVALGSSDIDHYILENGQEFVVQTKLSGAAWGSYEHFVNWVAASNKALGKTVNEKDPVELWKGVRVAMPNVDKIPPYLLEKLRKDLDKELHEVRQWLKDENIVIDVSSVYD